MYKKKAIDDLVELFVRTQKEKRIKPIVIEERVTSIVENIIREAIMRIKLERK